MSTQHTPHRLDHIGFSRVKAHSIYAHPELRAEDSNDLVAFMPEHQMATARRLAACWNAFDGLPTEYVEHMVNVPEFFFKHTELLAQRDELLLALQMLLEWHESTADDDEEYSAVRDARAAIAKATGATA